MAFGRSRIRQRREDLSHSQKFEGIIENSAAMSECHCRVVMETSKQNMPVEPAESREISSSGTTKCLWIKVEEKPFHHIGLKLIA